MSHHPPTNDDEAVAEAMNKLWSVDDSVRQQGRRELFRIGSSASVPLVNLLKDLIRDLRPRFVVEGEEEGRRALEEFVNLARHDWQAADKSTAYQKVSSLAINTRLIEDAISLLGELRSLEAVPILIRIMERKESMSEGIGMEMEALMDIGYPAVPSLIRSIENANGTAISASGQWPIRFGYRCSLDPDDELDDGDEDDIEGDEAGGYTEGNSVLDPEDEWEINMRTLAIKGRALRVLAEVGDTSALPFLEQMASEDGDIAPSVRATIRQIRNEPLPGNNPAQRPRRRSQVR